MRELREQLGISRSELSARTVTLGRHVPPVTIAAYEMKPGRIPDADHLQVLAQALGVDPASFYEWPIAVAQRAERVKAEAKLKARELQAANARAAERQTAAPDTKRPRRDRTDRAS